MVVEIPLMLLMTVDVICATPGGRSTNQLWGLRAVLGVLSKDTRVLRSDRRPFHFLEQPDPVIGPSSPFLSMSPLLKFLRQPNLWHCLCLEISRGLSKVLITLKTPMSQCCASSLTQKSLLANTSFVWMMQCSSKKGFKKMLVKWKNATNEHKTQQF